MVESDYERWKSPHHTYKDHERPEEVGLEREGVHSFYFDDLPVDFLTSGLEAACNTQSRSFAVVFSGALQQRGGSHPPYFSGITIARDLRLPFVLISDPTLSLSNRIKLAWYVGNHKVPHLYEFIASALDSITRKTALRPILIGGSGGGYAAIQVLARMQEFASALVWNPQTSIGSYYLPFGIEYMRTAYPNIKIPKDCLSDGNNFQSFLEKSAKTIPHKLPHPNLIKKHQLLYMQNVDDTFHMHNHAGPWLKNCAFSPLSNNTFLSETQNILFVPGSWGQGHAPLATALVKDLTSKLACEPLVKNIALSHLDEHSAIIRPISWIQPHHSIEKSVKIQCSRANNQITIHVSLPQHLKSPRKAALAFYLYDTGEKVDQLPYQFAGTAAFHTASNGKLTVVTFIKDHMGTVVRMKTPVPKS